MPFTLSMRTGGCADQDLAVRAGGNKHNIGRGRIKRFGKLDQFVDLGMLGLVDLFLFSRRPITVGGRSRSLMIFVIDSMVRAGALTTMALLFCSLPKDAPVDAFGKTVVNVADSFSADACSSLTTDVCSRSSLSPEPPSFRSIP